MEVILLFLRMKNIPRKAKKNLIQRVLVMLVSGLHGFGYTRLRKIIYIERNCSVYDSFMDIHGFWPR